MIFALRDLPSLEKLYIDDNLIKARKYNKKFQSGLMKPAMYATVENKFGPNAQGCCT